MAALVGNYTALGRGLELSLPPPGGEFSFVKAVPGLGMALAAALAPAQIQRTPRVGLSVGDYPVAPAVCVLGAEDDYDL